MFGSERVCDFLARRLHCCAGSCSLADDLMIAFETATDQ